MEHSTMVTILDYLGRNSVLIIFGAGTVIALFGIVFGSLTSMCKTSHREHTRREIAAYIAEGSMTPEQGERLLRAEPDSQDA